MQGRLTRLDHSGEGVVSVADIAHFSVYCPNGACPSRRAGFPGPRRDRYKDLYYLLLLFFHLLISHTYIAFQSLQRMSGTSNTHATVHLWAVDVMQFFGAPSPAALF